MARDPFKVDECDDCGALVHTDELYVCAGGPIGGPNPKHCVECLPDCGPCRDDMAREWADEHGPRAGG